MRGKEKIDDTLILGTGTLKWETFPVRKQYSASTDTRQVDTTLTQYWNLSYSVLCYRCWHHKLVIVGLNFLNLPNWKSCQFCPLVSSPYSRCPYNLTYNKKHDVEEPTGMGILERQKIMFILCSKLFIKIYLAQWMTNFLGLGLSSSHSCKNPPQLNFFEGIFNRKRMWKCQ